jgi:uncharacterized protein YraI
MEVGAMRSMIALAAVILLAAGSAEAAIGQRCEVKDPTGGPLNVRTGPRGAVVGAIPNGMKLIIVDEAVIDETKTWARVNTEVSLVPLGWVYRDYLACK